MSSILVTHVEFLDKIWNSEQMRAPEEKAKDHQNDYLSPQGGLWTSETNFMHRALVDEIF